MVTVAERARQAAAGVRDPEIQVLSVAELGILREVEVDEHEVVRVTITPTYVGCPAMETIRSDIAEAVRAAGFTRVEVITSWSPAWTTAWLSEQAREKLRAAGIAPPRDTASAPGVPSASPRLLPLLRRVPDCPHCGAADTTELSMFGSTACKALWCCRSCGEPFDRFKEH